MRDDCIDCGAAGTPTRESRTDGGFLSRVRRCESCEAREAEWRARWQAGLRRNRGPKVTTTPPARPSAARPSTAAVTDRDSREAFLAAIGA
jgi:hypothetical protein